MKILKEIMQRFPLTCRKKELIYDVASRMLFYGVNVLPVINRREKIIGEISYADICRVMESGKAEQVVWVSEIMRRTVNTINLYEDEAAALLEMRRCRSSYLFVVDHKERLKGFISFMTLARRIVQFKQRIAEPV